MLQAVVLSFLAGLVGGSGFPHFVKGIVGEEFPCALGNSPVRNVVAGWATFVLTAFLLYWAHIDQHAIAALLFGALGLLCISLFHATGGASRLNSLLGRANPPRYQR